MRRAVGAFILLAWVASLGWLLSRTSSDQRSLVAAGQRLAPFSGYYTAKLGGEQIGLGTVFTDTTESSFRVNNLLSLDLLIQGQPIRFGYRSDSYFDRGLALQTGDETVSDGTASTRYTIVSDSSDSARMHLRTASPMTADLGADVAGSSPAPATLARAIPYQMVLADRLTNDLATPNQVFDPADGSLRFDNIRVVGESTFVVPDSAVLDPEGHWRPATTLTVRAWQLEHAPYGLPTSTWVDSRGNLVAEQNLFGVGWNRTAFEIARNNYRSRVATDGITITASLSGARPWAGSGLAPLPGDSLRLMMGRTDDWPLPQPLLRGLEGGRQRLDHGYLISTRTTPPAESETAPMGYSVRYVGREVESVVTDRARRLAGKATDRLLITKRLLAWVASNIALDTSMGAPLRPPDVLAAQRAGSDGRSRLLAAMLRSERIPARVVTGVVLTVEGQLGHSWVEVWLDGWVAADPQSGTLPASPALIRLREGGRSRPVDLVPLIAALRVQPYPWQVRR